MQVDFINRYRINLCLCGSFKPLVQENTKRYHCKFSMREMYKSFFSNQLIFLFIEIGYLQYMSFHLILV